MIFEDNLLEMDLFRLHARVKKGVYVASEHYQDAGNFKRLEPRPTGTIRRLANQSLLRYILLRSSVALRYNIPWHLRGLLGNFKGERK